MLVTVHILADLGRFWPQNMFFQNLFFCQNRPRSAKIFAVTSIPVVERQVLPQSWSRTVGSTPMMLVTVNILADLGGKIVFCQIYSFCKDLPISATMCTVANILGVEPTVLHQSGGRTVGSTPGMLVTVNILANLGRFWQQNRFFQNRFFCQKQPISAKIFTVTSILGVERSVLPQSGCRTVGSTPEMLVTVHILADLGRKIGFCQIDFFCQNRPRSAKIFTVTIIPVVERSALP